MGNDKNFVVALRFLVSTSLLSVFAFVSACAAPPTAEPIPTAPPLSPTAESAGTPTLTAIPDFQMPNTAVVAALDAMPTPTSLPTSDNTATLLPRLATSTRLVQASLFKNSYLSEILPTRLQYDFLAAAQKDPDMLPKIEDLEMKFVKNSMTIKAGGPPSANSGGGYMPSDVLIASDIAYGMVTEAVSSSDGPPRNFFGHLDLPTSKMISGYLGFTMLQGLPRIGRRPAPYNEISVETFRYTGRTNYTVQLALMRYQPGYSSTTNKEFEAGSQVPRLYVRLSQASTFLEVIDLASRQVLYSTNLGDLKASTKSNDLLFAGGKFTLDNKYIIAIDVPPHTSVTFDEIAAYVTK